MTERLFCKWTETHISERGKYGEPIACVDTQRVGVIEGYIAIDGRAYAVVSDYPRLEVVPLDDLTLGTN